MQAIPQNQLKRDHQLIKKAGINRQCNMQANDKDMANLSETVCETFIYILFPILKKLTLNVYYKG